MRSEQGLLRRRWVAEELLRERGDLAVVGGLGAPAWDITAAGDCDLNLPLWGGMGAAAMIGLGVALARPERPALVVTGDGEMLMGIGSLASIAVQAPANLSVVVLDNGVYGETGMQRTHTSYGADLARIAEGAGFPRALTIREAEGVTTLRDAIHAGAGPLFACIKIDPEKLPLVLPPEGIVQKNRFRRALIGDQALYA
jgi:thiamine pyrophosphate-dependent acetolactate synthase large subunit-like protein